MHHQIRDVFEWLGRGDARIFRVMAACVLCQPGNRRIVNACKAIQQVVEYGAWFSDYLCAGLIFKSNTSWDLQILIAIFVVF